MINFNNIGFDFELITLYKTKYSVYSRFPITVVYIVGLYLIPYFYCIISCQELITLNSFGKDGLGEATTPPPPFHLLPTCIETWRVRFLATSTPRHDISTSKQNYLRFSNFQYFISIYIFVFKWHKKTREGKQRYFRIKTELPQV